MINGYKLANFLDLLEITIEEYWLCYRIMILKNAQKESVEKVPSNEDVLFGQLSTAYQNRFKKKLDFRAMLNSLEEAGYLDIWTKDLLDTESFKLQDISLNEKFLRHYYISDIDEAWNEFLKIYPLQLQVKNKFETKLYSSFGKKAISELISLFQTLILKGNSKIEFSRFMIITEKYLDDQSSKYAPMNIESYLNAFEGIAISYEANGDIQETFKGITNDI